MRISFLVFLLTSFLAIPSHSAGVYEIKTVKDKTVLVSADSVLAAYKLVQDDLMSINMRIKNEDGSISVMHPHMMYVGKLIPLYADYSAKDELNGVCKHFNLGAPVTYESSEGQSDNVLILKEDGSIDFLDNSKDAEIKLHPLESITCRAK